MTVEDRIVEFSAWQTDIAESEVAILALQFDALKRQLDVVLGQGDERFVARFAEVEAFRVLDEGGLTQLWAASAENARPGRTTFRVRGHKWTSESEIVFHLGTSEGWSYVIATGDDCIEVLTRTEPLIGQG
jgi:hypothetical protein